MGSAPGSSATSSGSTSTATASRTQASRAFATAALTLRKQSDGSVVGTTSSDATGLYQFGGLCQGDYLVDVATPVGYAPAASLAGGDRSIDSNGSGTMVSLATNSATDLTVDFGYVLGNIAGKAFLDANHNGSYDMGVDSLLAGVPIGLTGPTPGSMVTGATGLYGFDQRLGGSYTVTAPATFGGYQLTSASPAGVNLSAGSFQSVDFAYVAGTISGRVYVDLNANGVRDSGDLDLSGVGIGLTGPATASTTTAGGAYGFSQLAGGNYTVGAPGSFGGYLLASPAAVGATLAPGGTGTADFRYVAGSIAGRAYVDLNANGVRDSGDLDLVGRRHRPDGAGHRKHDDRGRRLRVQSTGGRELHGRRARELRWISPGVPGRRRRDACPRRHGDGRLPLCRRQHRRPRVSGREQQRRAGCGRYRSVRRGDRPDRCG